MHSPDFWPTIVGAHIQWLGYANARDAEDMVKVREDIVFGLASAREAFIGPLERKN